MAIPTKITPTAANEKSRKHATVENRMNAPCTSMEINIGLTKNEFEEQYNGYKSAFKNNTKRNSNDLRKYMWDHKEQ